MKTHNDDGTCHIYSHETNVTETTHTPDTNGVHGQMHELSTLLACLNETCQYDNDIRTRKVPSSHPSSLDRTTVQVYASVHAL
jgi:hypothetical protein